MSYVETPDSLATPSERGLTAPPVLRPRGSNHVGMRQFNERVVLQAIRLNGSLPKAELARLAERIAALEPRIRRACDFITAGYPTIISNSSHAVNRIIIAAKAFGTCGLVLHDDKLIATSRKLIAHALTLRDKDGVFIENGGRDSSYNVVSIFFGQTLALHVPLPEFEAALPQAVAWQLTKIRDNGEVDVTGNTRTGVGKEKSYSGQPKDVNYNEVVFALTYYGLAHHDQVALTAADRVFAFSHPR